MMDNSKILLSLCIPTYNRGDILKQSLERFVQNPLFNEEVEIVISDNASSDNTQEIGEYYAAICSNIKYYRNIENIRDRNFPLSMDRATGKYLKLMKDNIIMSEKGLEYMLDAIRKNLNNRKPLFFTNGFFYNSRFKDCYPCKDFDDFIIHTSYRITAITFFGCWRDQWQKIVDREKYSKLQLAQDDWTYQLIEQEGESLLYTRKFFSVYEVGKRGGYNWFEVHVANYYKIMQDYCDKGLISQDALKKEKNTYLKELKPQFVQKYLWKLFPKWDFDMSGATTILWCHFKNIPYFYFLMLSFPIWGIWVILKYKIRDVLIKIGLWNNIKKKVLKGL